MLPHPRLMPARLAPLAPFTPLAPLTPLAALAATAAAAALLAGCASPPPSPRAPLKLTILHTNDHHGRFWTNADGEYGLAARKTLIDQQRAEIAAAGGYVLLLDGGDVNTGVPESDLQDAEPDFKGMDRIGYDAMAVGNHEFDKPNAVLAKQRGWIQFPMLAANIYKDGARMFEPFKLFERGGYKIAVMGLTTDDTNKMVLPENLRGIVVRPPVAEAAALVPTLRAQADMVIATTHMGHYPNGNRGVNAPGDVEMARAVPGLDLVVGGHSQNPVCMSAENQRNDAYVPGTPCAPDRQNGAWIVQAHEWGKYLGRADFVIDGGQITLVSYRLLPVNLKRPSAAGATGTKSANPGFTAAIAPDAGLLAYLQPFQSAGQARLGVAVGEVDALLDGDRFSVRKQPTNLGTLIARAMMDKTSADLAILNAGGVRDSVAAGAISYRDLLKVQPFSNTVAVVTLTGAELLDYLRATARMAPNSGAFAQTAGVQLRIAGNVLQTAQVAGREIEPARRYRLAITNFTATGGDGYPVLKAHPGYVDSGFVDADVLRSYIAAHSPLKAADFAPGDAVQRR